MTTDDLTPDDEAEEPVGLPREVGPSSRVAPADRPRLMDPDLVDDAAAFVDEAADTADALPGDGTEGTPPPFGDVDALRTAAEFGPEADAARADTSDATPTPTETHPD